MGGPAFVFILTSSCCGSPLVAKLLFYPAQLLQAPVFRSVHPSSLDRIVVFLTKHLDMLRPAVQVEVIVPRLAELRNSIIFTASATE
jgi:hypothetical protein